MQSVTDVIVFIFEWCRDTYLTFPLFSRSWSFSILSILLMPWIATIGIFVVKEIFSLAKD